MNGEPDRDQGTLEPCVSLINLAAVGYLKGTTGSVEGTRIEYNGGIRSLTLRFIWRTELAGFLEVAK